MTSSEIHRLLLWAAATNRTFEERRVGSSRQRVRSGKWFHRGRRHTITPAGEASSSANVEHMIPKNHGGEDSLENFAIACTRCNVLEGSRLDCRR